MGIYTYEDDPRGNGIVLLYSGTIIGGDIQPNDEMMQVKFFQTGRNDSSFQSPGQVAQGKLKIGF